MKLSIGDIQLIVSSMYKNMGVQVETENLLEQLYCMVKLVNMSKKE